MRDNELELIAALAEGTLEDESEARALVESSTEHRQEYEAQKMAVEAMRSMPPARLSETEKAALHRDLWTELRVDETPAARAPWYYRWVLGGAAILFVGVGLVAVLNQDASEEGATAAFDEVSEDLADGEADSPAPLAGNTGADDDVEQVDTTEASSAEEAMTDEAGIGFFVDIASSLRLQSSRSLSSDDPSFAEEHDDCLSRAGLDGYVAIRLLGTEEAESGGIEAINPYLVAIPAEAELAEDTPVAFVETDTCLLVHLDE